MINCIVVDDEFKSRESLKILLDDFCEGVEVNALCQNVSEAVQAIAQYKPEVVFLDIQLQRESGFDLLTQLENIDFEVIFTTAYSHYALKAIKFSAIDYLLKPINIEELQKSLEKIRKRHGHNMAVRLEQLIHNLKPSSVNHYKLALPTSDGLIFIKIEEIIYCEASSNYTRIHSQDGKHYLVSRTLKEYEDLLADQGFFRIHNSFLINLHYIKKYIRGEGGYVIMDNNVSIDVSKRKKEAFLKKIYQ